MPLCAARNLNGQAFRIFISWSNQFSTQNLKFHNHIFLLFSTLSSGRRLWNDKLYKRHVSMHLAVREKKTMLLLYRGPRILWFLLAFMKLTYLGAKIYMNQIHSSSVIGNKNPLIWIMKLCYCCLYPRVFIIKQTIGRCTSMTHAHRCNTQRHHHLTSVEGSRGCEVIECTSVRSWSKSGIKECW